MKLPISKRAALRLARRFVSEQYPEHEDDYLEICRDGETGWSFGVHIDQEDPRFDKGGTNDFTGYVFVDQMTGKPVVQGLF